MIDIHTIFCVVADDARGLCFVGDDNNSKFVSIRIVVLDIVVLMGFFLGKALFITSLNERRFFLLSRTNV
jgi:hypothetical protein